MAWHLHALHGNFWNRERWGGGEREGRPWWGGRVVRNLGGQQGGPGLRQVDKSALGNSAWAQLLWGEGRGVYPSGHTGCRFLNHRTRIAPT